MDRPETIELVGQTLRWSEGRIAYESAPPPDLPRLVTSPDLGEGDGWECVVRVCGDNRVYIRAPTLPALDLALRAALAEVADAVAAWLPEREARIHADAAKMAMELAAQRNALSEAIDTVCGLDHELKSTGGAVPSNALDALRGWEARVRAEERERCAAVIQKGHGFA